MSVTKRLSAFLGKTPIFGDDVYIAPTAVIVGNVRIGSRSSVWYNAVLRGDINYISIGDDTNIQDGVIGHLADDFPLICLLYTSPSPRDISGSRMPSSA